MGEIIASGINVAENIVGNGIPVTTIKPLKNERPQELLIIYGGSTKKNFRRVVKEKWGEELARRGFTVHCFDFRSNLPDHDFYQFGLWDRRSDAFSVALWLLNRKKNPLTLVGGSMGGHLAVEIASFFGNFFPSHVANLVLVAPAAY